MLIQFTSIITIFSILLVRSRTPIAFASIFQSQLLFYCFLCVFLQCLPNKESWSARCSVYVPRPAFCHHFGLYCASANTILWKLNDRKSPPPDYVHATAQDERFNHGAALPRILSGGFFSLKFNSFGGRRYVTENFPN